MKMDKAFKYFTPILLKTYNQRNGHRFVNPIVGTKASVNFVANYLKSKRLIYFGEIHGVPNIVKFQETVLDFLVSEVREERRENADDDVKVVVIMEHFAGPKHQRLLDRYMSGDKGREEAGPMSIENFIEKYKRDGEEGHDLAPYSQLLKLARDNADVVELKAGFIPRSYAKLLVAEGEDVGLEAAYNDGYLDRLEPYMPGSENHYNFFESLISGRDLSQPTPANERFRRIFPAQIVKDAAMAHVVAREVKASEKNRLLVICGSGHCEYRFGVPERVDRANVLAKEESCIISTRRVDHYEIDWKKGVGFVAEEPLMDGPFEKIDEFENKFPADILFFYDDEDDVENGTSKDEPGDVKTQLAEKENSADLRNNRDNNNNVNDATVDVATIFDQIKTEIADAYDQVGKTAHIEGDSRLAATVMTFLEYSDEQIKIADRDAFNYQGVGNPHKHVQYARGDRVLDLGSGLGVDSFIAAERVGPNGSVVGLDISKGEVVHATKRAKARGIDHRVKFVNADMENTPLENDSIDVVISNGAFCLAPDKEKAFKEIYRVLKPGGRFSVACTTLLKELDGDVQWPICMRVFMPLVHARPMLDHVGFREVAIDSSNSLMTYTLEIDDAAAAGMENDSDEGENGVIKNDASQNRKKIHVGSEDFRHLENFDMNQLCARVILHGKKPD